MYDIEAHLRFLVALPLLIAAELLVHKRLRIIVGEFVEQDIITENVLPKFKKLISSAMRLRNSIVMELLLLVLVVFLGIPFGPPLAPPSELLTPAAGMLAHLTAQE